VAVNPWLRRIRGAVGMGLTWGLAWFAAGMALLMVVGPDAADVPFPLGFGALGFLAGTTFSVVVGSLAGRVGFHEMSLPKFAGWGALGGVVFAALFAAMAGAFGNDVGFVTPGIVFGLAGAGTAAGALTLARRAVDPERLEDGEEVERVGLTDEERRDLLGG
jgi:hypothetical protein